jgi:hypothetical protein
VEGKTSGLVNFFVYVQRLPSIVTAGFATASMSVRAGRS